MKHKNRLTEMMKAILNGRYILSKSINAFFLVSMVFFFAVITNSCNKEKAELPADIDYEYSSEVNDDYESDDEGDTKSGAQVPRANDNSAFWCAESGSIVGTDGAIYTANGTYKANFRTASTPAPFWKRVKSPTYQGNRSWEVVSQSGNNRSEVATLIKYKPLVAGQRWFSFAMRIDPTTTQGFILCQLHQSANAGRNGNPPIFMRYTGSQWQLAVRTDNSVLVNGVPGDYLRTLASGTMNKGQWYHFQLGLLPGLNGNANIKLYQKINGTWQQHSLDWGTYPANTAGYKYTDTGALCDWESFQFKVGIYGAATSKATIHLDNISYGKTKSHLQGL